MGFDELVHTVTGYSGPDAGPVLTTAFQIAQDAHNGFQRLSGEPYLNHTLAVAGTLAEWKAPPYVVAVGLLHDLLNQNYSHERSLDRIQHTLGREVSQLLEGVSQLNHFTARLWGQSQQPSEDSSKAERTGGRLRDVVLTLHQDPIALVVKLADRLHNLETIQALPPHRQERSANAALNIFSPLADRLGLRIVKRQLDDLSFAILNPDDWSLLQKQYRNDEIRHKVESVLSDLQQAMNGLLPTVQIHWQPTHLYGLYRRQLEQHNHHLTPLETGCFIIITDDETGCYRVLGAIHQLYTPVEGRFRDLIGDSKENGYRSLHTRVKYRSGIALDIVIRTEQMGLLAEYGITAQWRGVTKGLPQIPEAPTLKPGEILVFTPQGDVKRLPQGATPVDFAYAIHSDVGHRCARALVNGKHTPLDHPLQNGDKVEIILGGTGTEPKPEWLNFVKTSYAGTRIRKRLATQQSSAMAQQGQELIEKELYQFGLSVADPPVTQALDQLASQQGFPEFDDLLISVGVGRLKPSKLVEQLRSVISLEYPEPAFNIVVLSSAEAFLPRRLARCCNPLPSDEIIGYHRSDNRISIHKRTCSHIKNRDRLLQVKWDFRPIEPAHEIIVIAWNRIGLARDISEILSAQGVDMLSLDAHRRPDGTAEARILLEKTLPEKVDHIIAELHTISLVQNVRHNDLQSADSETSGRGRWLRQPNPYSISGPARGKRFYGRDVEFRTIVDRLRNPHQSTAILIWGQKRIGKTSLLHYLADQLLKDDFLPVLVNVEGLRSVSTVEFMYRLMTSIDRQLKGIVDVPDRHRLKKDPLAHFHTYMMGAQQVAGIQRVLLMLDEFQHLVSLRQENVSRKDIFSHLRSLIQDGMGIDFILSGGGLVTRLVERASIVALLSIAHDLKLGCLDDEAVRQMIYDGLFNVAEYEEKTVEWLFDITAGHPFYVNLLCSSLFDDAQAGFLKKLSPETASQMVDTWLSKIDKAPYFQHLWAGGNSDDSRMNKVILSAIAELGAENSEVGYERLFSAIGPAVPEKDLVRLLKELAYLGILKDNRLNYTIKVKLFTEWLRRHWPLEAVLKETGLT